MKLLAVLSVLALATAEASPSATQRAAHDDRTRTPAPQDQPAQQPAFSQCSCDGYACRGESEPPCAALCRTPTEADCRCGACRRSSAHNLCRCRRP